MKTETILDRSAMDVAMQRGISSEVIVEDVGNPGAEPKHTYTRYDCEDGSSVQSMDTVNDPLGEKPGCFVETPEDTDL